MSQARRSRVVAAQRHRQQMADSLLAAGVSGMYPGPAAQPGDPLFFDVHAAREHALTLARRDADNVYDRRRRDLGLRLIEALRGQPLYCESYGCMDGDVAHGPFQRVPSLYGGSAYTADHWADCPDCRGTGHNLKGTLPPIVWSPAVRRKVADAFAVDGTRRPSWVDRAFPDGVHYGPVLARSVKWTVLAGGLRVVPRGEHDDAAGRALDMSPRRMAEVKRLGLTVPTLDERINLRRTASEYADAGARAEALFGVRPG